MRKGPALLCDLRYKFMGLGWLVGRALVANGAARFAMLTADECKGRGGSQSVGALIIVAMDVYICSRVPHAT